MLTSRSPAGSKPRAVRRLQPEMALVLACVRWPRGAVETDEIRVAASRVSDWSLVERLRSRHRVTGLASSGLLEAGVDLPADVRERAAAEVKLAGLSELRAAAEARRLLDALHGRSVAARLLKGPAVSLLAFGRLGLRTNRDIDILVTPAERPLAVTALEAAGYSRIDPPITSSPAMLEDWVTSRKDFAFAHPGGSLVELHWRLFDNPALLKGLEAGLPERIEAGAFRFDTLNRTDNILYLCTHGAQHAWSRLKWLADVSAMLRPLDREEIAALLDRAGTLGVRPAVGQALVLASRHMMLDLPDQLRRRLEREPRLRLLAAIAERALFAGGGLELEEQPFGPTWKNISHYLIATGREYRSAEVHFDLYDLSAAGLPDSFRRFGPFARLFGRFLHRPKAPVN